MASDRSSSSAQGVEIPTSVDTNFDGETLSVNHDSATTNGHADPSSKKTFEGSSPGAIKIEPSPEEAVERADDGSATGSVPSDDGDGLQAVPLNNDKPNVCFSNFPSSPEHYEAQEGTQGTHVVNEHLAPRDHIQNHDTGGQQPETAISTTLDVSPSRSYLQSLLRDVQTAKPEPQTASLPASPHTPDPPPTPPEKVVPSALRRQSLPPVQLNGTHAVESPSMSSNSLPSAPSPGGTSHRRSLTISRGNTVSSVLITSALETIAASREAKKSPPLRESSHKALELVRADLGGDQPRQIFEPLRLACETRSEKLMIASLDCITKLISHSFFVDDSSPHLASLPSPPPSPGPGRRDSHSSIPEPSLVDLVVHTITSCHTETSSDPVSLQVVRALLSLVLSQTILVHQSALLKAVRTIYNIFLMSNDPVNQTVAQGGLTQMVNHVFTRCKTETPYGGTDRESVTDSGVSGISSRRGSAAPSTPDSVPASALPTGEPTSEGGGGAPKEERNGQDLPILSPTGTLETSPAYS